MTLIVRVALISAGFLTSIITARFLGPEGRGIYFYWTTIAALLIQFGNLGLHSSNTYYLAKGDAKLSTLAVNSLWVSLASGLVLGAALTGFIWLQNSTLHGEWPYLLPVLAMVPAGLYFLLGTNLLVALDRFSEYNAFELLGRYIGVLAIVFAAWRWATPESLLIALGISATVICLPLYLRLQALGGAGSPSTALLRKAFRYSIRAYLIAVLGFLTLRVNVLLLERFVDPMTLGVWSIAAQLLDVVIIIPGTVALVMLPKIMRAADPFRMMQSQLRLVVVVLVGICALAALLGGRLILWVYGEGFAGSYELLMWGLPAAFAIGLISIHSQYLAAAGMPASLVWIWLAGLIIEVGFAVWLIPSLGGVGAMASLSAAHIVVLGLVWGLAGYTSQANRAKDDA